MPNIAILRHGETVANATRTFQGQSDNPLNPSGFKQVSELAVSLMGVGQTTIHASTYLRAKQTAEIINQTIGGRLLFSPLLCERHLGVLDGHTISSIEAKDATVRLKLMTLEFAPQGGESGADCLARFERGLSVALAAAQSSPQIVVTHGGVAALFARHRLGADPNDCFLSPASAHVFNLPPQGEPRIIALNVRLERLREAFAENKGQPE